MHCLFVSVPCCYDERDFVFPAVDLNWEVECHLKLNSISNTVIRANYEEVLNISTYKVIFVLEKWCRFGITGTVHPF